MFDPMSDESDIRSARSRYNARETDSPLIAWICSPEWTDPDATWYPEQTTRGLIHELGAKTNWRFGSRTYGANIASGEINAATCHCHKPMRPCGGCYRCFGEPNFCDGSAKPGNGDRW